MYFGNTDVKIYIQHSELTTSKDIVILKLPNSQLLILGFLRLGEEKCNRRLECLPECCSLKIRNVLGDKYSYHQGTGDSKSSDTVGLGASRQYGFGGYIALGLRDCVLVRVAHSF
jgi:hypothetical protein